MYNPPVLLEYVPLVRRLLAASKHPDVVRVGKLGEITYLVDEHVERAEVIDAATGESELEEFEWSPGHPILHPEFLRLAAEVLEAALACEPGLREQEDARAWVGDWNTRFAAVLQEPAFRHLTQ